MNSITTTPEYARLIQEEKDHYSKIEVTQELTEGGLHASSSWKYYWSRVAEELHHSAHSDIAGYLKCLHSKHNRTLKILSLGSGYCGHELNLAHKLNCPYEIICTDINETLFSEARKRAQASNLCLQFEVQDLNFIRIPSGQYDMIFAHAALHHVINLETLFEQIAQGLNVDGILHIVEVIGKNRRLLWEENERFANLILDALPHKLTRGAKLTVSEGEGMEGIRQEDILPILRATFQPVYEYTHGAFMRYICTDENLGRYLHPEEMEAKRYLDLLIDIDRSTVRNLILRPLEIWGIYRPL
jgi:SAM-dependent methyltransferase